MIAEMMDVESWERLASQADEEHLAHQSELAALQRRRAAAALAGMMTGELDATREIDNQLVALEYKIAGQAEVRRMIQRGLEAAIEIQSADTALAQLAETRTAAQRRAELAAAVDTAMAELAESITRYLDSLDGTRPDRASGNLTRAFWWQFSKTRNRPAWWRKCIAGLSDSPHSMASVAPLSATTDPAILEADTLEAAALKSRAEALEAIKALTLPHSPVSGKSRQNRKLEALEAA